MIPPKPPLKRSEWQKKQKTKIEQINLLFEELLITHAITSELRVLYRRRLNALLNQIEITG